MLLNIGSCYFPTFVWFRATIIKDRDEKGARNAILKETNIFKRVVLKQNNNVPIPVSRAFCETQPRLACICHYLELGHDPVHAGSHLREGFATPAALAVSSHDQHFSKNYKMRRPKWKHETFQTLIKLFFGNFPGEVKPKCNTAPQQLHHIVTWRVLDSVLQPLQLCPKAARVLQG